MKKTDKHGSKSKFMKARRTLRHAKANVKTAKKQVKKVIKAVKKDVKKATPSKKS